MFEMINEISASYPAWAKLTMVLYAALLLGTLVLARSPTKKEASANPVEQPPPIKQEVGSVGRDAFNIQGSTINLYQHSPQTPERPIKDRIRSFLRTVNPAIVDALDSGKPQISVMVNTVNLPALMELKKDPDFGAYLDIISTGSVIVGGSGNRIGGHLNDVMDTGAMNGFTFRFKERLKL